MIVFGDEYYATVDWVPGLFYVRTRFLHIWYFPIVPRESYLFLDEDLPADSLQGCQIPMSFKSICLAWFRAGLVVGAMMIFMLGCTFISLAINNGAVAAYILAAAAWLLMIILVSLFPISSMFRSATLSRAIELGKRAGIPQETVEEHFTNAR